MTLYTIFHPHENQWLRTIEFPPTWVSDARLAMLVTRDQFEALKADLPEACRLDIAPVSLLLDAQEDETA